MAINQLSSSNTFQQWLTATQALITAQNYFEGNVANVALANTNIQAANSFIQSYNIAAISNIQSAQTVAYANVTTGQADAYANVVTIQSTAYANVVAAQSSAYANVNTVYGNAVTLSILVQDKSNTTNTTAQTVFDYVSTAYSTANTSNTVANQALVTAQLAYDTSNLAVSNLTFQATLVQAYNTANGAFDKANSANVLAQGSYDYANTVNTYAQAAFAKANTNANTDFTNINITAGTYGNATIVPVVTVGANGRVIAIANVDISGVGGGTTVVLTDDVSTDSTRYLTFANTTTGNVQTLYTSSSSLLFNPYTGTLSATVFSSLSDENLKNNIDNISNGTQIVEQLRGVTFDWKDGSGSSYGLIAQEVEKILPYAVTQGPEYKTVNYSAVIPFLIETIKDLNRRITQLENKQ